MYFVVHLVSFLFLLQIFQKRTTYFILKFKFVILPSIACAFAPSFPSFFLPLPFLLPSSVKEKIIHGTC